MTQGNTKICNGEMQVPGDHAQEASPTGRSRSSPVLSPWEPCTHTPVLTEKRCEHRKHTRSDESGQKFP